MDKYDVLIVGGSGFFGSHLARHMSEVFEVKVLDVKPLPEDLSDEISFQKCDVRRYESVKSGVEDSRLVVNTAIIGIPLINAEKQLGYEVNVLGTENVCEAVSESKYTAGLILTGTWHVFGERGLKGVIDEEFGCRPDKVEERARYYALSKTVQENIVRLYDEGLDKIYGIIRFGTILGEGMREKTAANTFISNALEGKPITPYKHSMYRPMLYVDLDDACRAVESYAKKILNNEVEERRSSLAHIVNFAWPNPITILELAEIVKDAITKRSDGKLVPRIEIVDMGLSNHGEYSKEGSMKLTLKKAMSFLGIKEFTEPRESIEKLVKMRMFPS